MNMDTWTTIVEYALPYFLSGVFLFILGILMLITGYSRFNNDVDRVFIKWTASILGVLILLASAWDWIIVYRIFTIDVLDILNTGKDLELEIVLRVFNLK